MQTTIQSPSDIQSLSSTSGKSDDSRSLRSSGQGFLPKSNSALNRIDFNSIESQLKILNLFDIDCFDIHVNGNLRAKNDISQILIDIYPQIKEDISIFEGTYNIEENTNPLSVLKLLLKLYNEVIDFDWEIAYSKGSFTLAITKELNIPDQGYGFDFIEFWEIRYQNKAVYKLAIEILRHLKFIGSEFWDEGEGSYVLDILDQEIFENEYNDKEQLNLVKDTKTYYESGAPKIAMDQVNESLPSIPRLVAYIKDLNIKRYALHRQMKEWAELVMQLSELGDVMDDYIAKHKESDDEMIKPDAWFPVIWSTYDDDPVWIYRTQTFQSTAENSYHSNFIKKENLNCSDQREIPLFLELLIKIFNKGCDITKDLHEKRKLRNTAEALCWADIVSIRNK